MRFVSSAESCTVPAEIEPASVIEACVWSWIRLIEAAAATAMPVCDPPGVPPDPPGPAAVPLSGVLAATAPATVMAHNSPPTNARARTASSTSMLWAVDPGVPGVASVSPPISARVRRSMSLTATDAPTPTAPPFATPPAHIAPVWNAAA